MEQANKKLLEPDWDKLTLADDFLFGYAMQNLDLCKEFLEMLLGKKIEKIRHFRKQDYIKHSPASHAVVLDVKLFADGRVINVEMQTTNKKDLILRSRYYQSTTDASLLPKGKLYTALPDLLTIFICTFDTFNKGLPLYTVRNTIKELGNKEYKDKRKILLYNTKAEKSIGSEELKELLHFINGNKPDCDRVKDFATAVEAIKQEGDFKEKYMNYYLKRNEAIAEGIQQGIHQGILQGKKEGLMQGIAQQKAKDEAIFAQKDTLLNSQAEQIRQLQAQLVAAGIKPKF